MQESAFAHAEHIDALFAVIFPVVDPLHRERVGNRLGSLLERDTVVTPVGLRLSSMPIELLFHTVLITSTKVKGSSDFTRKVMQLCHIYFYIKDIIIFGPRRKGGAPESLAFAAREWATREATSAGKSQQEGVFAA